MTFPSSLHFEWPRFYLGWQTNCVTRVWPFIHSLIIRFFPRWSHVFHADRPDRRRNRTFIVWYSIDVHWFVSKKLPQFVGPYNTSITHSLSLPHLKLTSTQILSKIGSSHNNDFWFSQWVFAFNFTDAINMHMTYARLLSTIWLRLLR